LWLDSAGIIPALHKTRKWSFLDVVIVISSSIFLQVCVAFLSHFPDIYRIKFWLVYSSLSLKSCYFIFNQLILFNVMVTLTFWHDSFASFFRFPKLSYFKGTTMYGFLRCAIYVPHTGDENGSTFLCMVYCCMCWVTFYLCVARIKKYLFTHKKRQPLHTHTHTHTHIYIYIYIYTH